MEGKHDEARRRTVSSPPPTRAGRLALFATLGAAAVYGPATMDINLPALPAIQDDLGTTVSGAQLTMTSYLIGLAIGQVVVGAFSDALGRRTPFIVGLLVYSAASAACAAAPSIEILVILRALQGVGAATGVVTVRAIVRDMYGGERAASYLSRLVLLIGLAPVLAPSIGAQILATTSWRGIFVALAVFGLLTLALTALVIPETLPPSTRRPLHARAMVTGFADLLRQRNFVGYILASGLASAVMITMITGSTFALQDDYGLSAQEFGFVFGIGAVTMIVVAQVNASLVRIVHPRTSTLVCASFTGIVCVSAAAAAALEVGPLPICIALVVALGAWGLVAPNTTALALTDQPHAAGSASALLGLAQFGLAGLIAPLTGLAGAGAVAIGVVTASLSFGAVAALLLLTPAGTSSSRARSQLSAEPAQTP